MAMKNTTKMATKRPLAKKPRISATGQKISPFLWFNDNAEAAAKFYISVFKNAKMLPAARNNGSIPGPKIMVAQFQIEGIKFAAINGGSTYKITPAVSFVVNCATQKEVDYYWAKLSAGGQELPCGWVTDKFGVSWQVTPTMLTDIISSDNAVGARRAMEAMFGMKKLDIAKLKAAYEGK